MILNVCSIHTTKRAQVFIRKYFPLELICTVFEYRPHHDFVLKDKIFPEMANDVEHLIYLNDLYVDEFDKKVAKVNNSKEFRDLEFITQKYTSFYFPFRMYADYHKLSAQSKWMYESRRYAIDNLLGLDNPFPTMRESPSLDKLMKDKSSKRLS